MEHMAIGLVETIGLIPAIEGLDASLKAAEVTLCSFEYVSGGLVTYIVEGEVAAVKAAVDAGGAAAEKVGKLLSVHVIPRPHEEVGGILKPPAKPGGRMGGTGIHKRDFSVGHKIENPPATAENAPKKATAKLRAPEFNQGKYIREELEKMKTTDLRVLARKTPEIQLKKIEIRDAKKNALVDAILRAQGDETK